MDGPVTSIVLVNFSRQYSFEKAAEIRDIIEDIKSKVLL